MPNLSKSNFRCDLDFKATDKYNETGLLLACKYGWKDIVKYLLKHRNIADIDIASTNNTTGNNCFMEAVLHKSVEVTELFIKMSKSDEEIMRIICATNKRHETAFHMACIKGTVGNVKHEKKLLICMFKCFWFFYLDLLQCFIPSTIDGIDLNAKDKFGKTALHLAFSRNEAIDRSVTIEKSPTTFTIMKRKKSDKILEGLLKKSAAIALNIAKGDKPLSPIQFLIIQCQG